MTWIRYNKDYFNLDKMKHIWVEKNKTTEGFFLMAESDSGEEIVISATLGHELECMNLLCHIRDFF